MIMTNVISSVVVGIGEISVTKDPSMVLTCTGVGSCIALCIWDPVAKVAGMAHMLLPKQRTESDNMIAPAKYINVGVPNLLHRMNKQGAEKSNMIVKVSGGAKMLSIPGNSNLDIGQKNIAEIKAALERENLPICGIDVGGGFGRTIQLFADNGRVTVKSANGRIMDL